MNSIQRFTDLLADGILVSRGTTLGPLTLFPLRHGLPPGDHLLYQEAHDRGLVTVEECSEAGRVSELTVTNEGSVEVLLLEGEVLLGMKQTRVLNVSVLVPALTTLSVPVSCVEAGRWHRTSRAALGRDRLNLSPAVRRATVGSAMRAARATGHYASNQARVWQGVNEALAAHRVDAPTRSFADIARTRGEEIHRQIRAIRPEPGQCGVLAFVRSRPVCMDLFDGPAALSALWEAVAGSYAADAHVANERSERCASRPPSRTRATRWVTSLADTPVMVAPPLGLGDHLTCSTPRVEVAALIHDEALLHLTALPAVG